eukprot:5255273-Amphidinium_carterae.1
MEQGKPTTLHNNVPEDDNCLETSGIMMYLTMYYSKFSFPRQRLGPPVTTHMGRILKVLTPQTEQRLLSL